MRTKQTAIDRSKFTPIERLALAALVVFCVMLCIAFAGVLIDNLTERDASRIATVESCDACYINIRFDDGSVRSIGSEIPANWNDFYEPGDRVRFTFTKSRVRSSPLPSEFSIALAQQVLRAP